jgi:hypothetical protein
MAPARPIKPEPKSIRLAGSGVVEEIDGTATYDRSSAILKLSLASKADCQLPCREFWSFLRDCPRMSILRSPVSNEKFEKRAVFERFPGGEDKVSLLGRLAGGACSLALTTLPANREKYRELLRLSCSIVGSYRPMVHIHSEFRPKQPKFDQECNRGRSGKYQGI